MTQPAKDKAAGPAQGQPQQGQAAAQPPKPAGQTAPGQTGPTQPRPAGVANPGAPAQPRPHQPGQPQPGGAIPRPGGPNQPGGPQQPKHPPGAQQRQPAGAAQPKRRHWLLLVSFIACVILPAIVTALYLWLVAADQYASRVGFTVRQEEAASATDLLGGLSNLSNSSSSDTDILYELIQSQKLVSEIDEELDLRTIWSRPEWDPVFAIDPEASIETLVDYWENMVKISYSAGLIEVEVRAFRPEDATAIATLGKGDKFDAVHFYEDDLDQFQSLEVA